MTDMMMTMITMMTMTIRMKTMILNNDFDAKFKGLDEFSRGVYTVNGYVATLVNVDGVLHTCSDDGEPDSPVTHAFQPKNPKELV